MNQHIAVTAHAAARMLEHGITPADLDDAATDAVIARQDLGRLENRGRNGVCFITGPDGHVITVLPRGTRPAPRHRPGIGANRHRRTPDGKRRPDKRTDQRRPRA